MSDLLHVMPVDDLIEHESDADCACGPDQDAEQPRLYLHHALDGREAAEGDRSTHADLMESGRRLASKRDDLIAAGIDPADLVVPLAPTDPEDHR